MSAQQPYCGSFLPGFMMLSGSNAALTACIADTPLAPYSWTRNGIFPVPMPCSPVHVPRSDIAFLAGDVSNF